MKLFKIEQNKNNGWDTYDSAVVAAKDENEARLIHPSYIISELWALEGWMAIRVDGSSYIMYDPDGGRCWTHPDNVTVTYIGEAVPGTERGVIVSSFNAG